MTKPDYTAMETEDLYELLHDDFVKVPGRICLKELKRRYDRLLQTMYRINEQYISPCDECATHHCQVCRFAGGDISHIIEDALRDVGAE